MKWGVTAFLGVFVTPMQGSRGGPQPRQALPKVFASAISGIKAKSAVPVLLPSKLPQSLTEVKYAVVAKVSEDGYAMSLYYKLNIGDAGFAASFGAEAHPNYGPKDIPNVSQVKLSHGVIGYFHPVICGGSCAPANIWWEENQTLYNMQIELSPTLPESDQRTKIVAVADSAITAGAR